MTRLAGFDMPFAHQRRPAADIVVRCRCWLTLERGGATRGSPFFHGVAQVEVDAKVTGHPGKVPIARDLDRVLVSRRSPQYHYIPKLEAILYGPDRLTMPLLSRLLAATAAADQPKAIAWRRRRSEGRAR